MSPGETPSPDQLQEDIQGAEVQQEPAVDVRPDTWTFKQDNGKRWLVRLHHMPRLSLFLHNELVHAPLMRTSSLASAVPSSKACLLVPKKSSSMMTTRTLMILIVHFKIGGLVRHGLRSSQKPKLLKDLLQRPEGSKLTTSARQTMRACLHHQRDSEIHRLKMAMEHKMIKLEMAQQLLQAICMELRNQILQNLLKVILPKELFYLMCRASAP